jgi:DNA-binding CsgD family transcriptional regulator
MKTKKWLQIPGEDMARSNEALTRLSDLIGLIYEGATDPGRWSPDILPALAEYIEAPECFLFTVLHTPQNGGYMFFCGITQDQMDLYFNRHHGEDLWLAATVEKKLGFEGSVILGEELIPRAQWLASKAYNECFDRDKNMAQLMTSVVFGLDSPNSMPACCSFFRGLHHPDFGEEDRARLRLVLPHLSRSLGVMHRLRLAELTLATTLAALDRLAHGVLLMDKNGAVTFANRVAHRMLAEEKGLRLLKRHDTAALGNLVAEGATATKAINEAIRATLNRDLYATTPHFSNCVKVPHPSGLASYTLQFSVLGEHNEFGRDTGTYAAIVFIADGAQELHIDPTMLNKAYGLTPAEAKVAMRLLECSSAQEVADKLGTSPHTVNTQIKQIYAKLGVNTRTRFVKLLSGLANYP